MKTILIIIGGLVVMGCIGNADTSEAERQLNDYCANVKLYNRTDKKFGWPDYREIYDKECGNESTNAS